MEIYRYKSTGSIGNYGGEVCNQAKTGKEMYMCIWVSQQKCDTLVVNQHSMAMNNHDKCIW